MKSINSNNHSLQQRYAEEYPNMLSLEADVQKTTPNANLSAKNKKLRL